jgi:hypothetical protein
MLVFPIELQSGKGFVLTQEVTAIMPHQTKKGWSVIFTDSLPLGLDIKGSAGELAEIWNEYLLEIEHGEAGE